MRAIILGSGAGGGIPQWNCACRICQMARTGDPRVLPRTQTSVAVALDGENWLLIGASPDLRQQVLQTASLAPRAARHSPIRGVILLNAEVDSVAGLLTLRERQAFDLIAPPEILAVLAENPIFAALDRELVRRVALAPGEPVQVGLSLRLTLVPIPGKVPLFAEEPRSGVAEAANGYAALLEADGKRLLAAPACAAITPGVRDLMQASDVVLFDGTLFSDQEMIAASVGIKTGRRMGHVPIGGPDGSLAVLSTLRARVVLLHINNTNPVLIEDSIERRAVEEAGVEVAHDGMELRL
jgi:pyrroloquinoline quinone biosynthesis protein B